MVPLLDRRLLIVSGKGGVGKSALSAALALLCARAGKRTLICEVNAAERISGLLGRPAVGAEISSLGDRLWAVNVQPEEAMREYVLMVVKLESIYKAVFENRFVRYFLRFIPSLQELVMLGKILHHLKETLPSGEPRFDTVIMDAPATGHVIPFLSVPKVIVDTVPAGAMSREASAMRALLENDKLTAAVLVSLPEEMPVNETIELAAELRKRVQVQPQAVVLNGFTSQRFSESDLEALRAKPSLFELAQAHAHLATLSADFRDVLERELHLPVLSVSRLYLGRFGPASIEAIADQLQPMLRAE